MDKQTKYAIDQYNMCCYHLNISPRYDDDGNTLFEEIVLMEKEIETLDKEYWDHRLNDSENFDNMKKQYQKLRGLIYTAIMHIDNLQWRDQFLQELKEYPQ